jgi:hypothetical protein
MATIPDIGSSRSSRRPSQEDIKRPNLKVGEVKKDVSQGKQDRVGGWRGVLNFLEKKGDVELRGCVPVPYEERKEMEYRNVFTLWFSMSCNPLP